MTVAPSTNMLFVGTRKNTAWAVTDRKGESVADEVKPFAPSARFHVPNGVCWAKDGLLIIVEPKRVLNFPAAEFYGHGDVAMMKDGSMLISDDFAGALYRVTYSAP